MQSNFCWGWCNNDAPNLLGGKRKVSQWEGLVWVCCHTICLTSQKCFTPKQFGASLLHHPQQNVLLHHPHPRPPHLPSGLYMLCAIMWCVLCTLWPLPCIFICFIPKNLFNPSKMYLSPETYFYPPKNLGQHYCTTPNKTFCCIISTQDPPLTKWLMYGMYHTVVQLMYTMNPIVHFFYIYLHLWQMDRHTDRPTGGWMDPAPFFI